jgi:hypothetical protein
MLSPREIASIRDEIKKLEEARENCNDGGVRKRIEAWIEGTEAEARVRAIKTLGATNWIGTDSPAPPNGVSKRRDGLPGTNHYYRSA